MSGWIEFVFWLSILGLAHTYFFYPLVILSLAQFSGKPKKGSELAVSNTELPSVTVLIAAYNAQRHIQERIENLLACDYPPALLRIVVASDGSTDDTASIVRRFANRNVDCLEFPDRAGKSATLIRAMATITSDVVIFSDTSTHFSAQSIKSIGLRFTDPAVGIVSGCVRMLDESGNSAEGAYWQLESRVRRAESRLGLLTGVSGAIYGIRRTFFVIPNRPTTNDDMVFPILLKHHHPCQFVFEPEAIATVGSPCGQEQEFRRRRRIGRGAFQSLGLLWPALLPSCGTSAVALISHKILRWLGPFALIIALLSNLVLAGQSFYFTILMLQCLFYLSALFGQYCPSNIKWIRPAKMVSSFFMMNLALLVGFIDWIVNAGNVTWEPTSRPNRFVPPR